MTEKQKRILSVALVIHVIMLSLTWRDLSKRPDAAVRGKKKMWRLASLLNTSGSAASNMTRSVPSCSTISEITSVRHSRTFSVIPSDSIITMWAPASK